GRDLEEGEALEITTEATDLLAVDLDGDLQPELIVSRRGGVTILRGSDGMVRDIEIGDAPNSLDLADFDGDGVLDLALVDIIGNTLEVLHGEGNGDFVPLASIAVGIAPEDLDLEDINGDGNIDVIARSRIGQKIWIIEGDGTGGFAEPWLLDSDSTPNSARGVLALPASDAGLFAIAAPSNLLQVLVSDGQQSPKGYADVRGWPATFLSGELVGGEGIVHALTTQAGPHTIVSEELGSSEDFRVHAVGDINDDGYADIVGIDDECELWIYTGSESGLPTTPTSIHMPFEQCYSPLELADLTGDGITDLFRLSLTSSGTIQVARGLGNLQFDIRPEVEFEHRSALDPAIVQHDEGAIIILPQGKDAGALRINVDSQGDASLSNTLMAGQSVWQARSADVDGDTQADVVLNSGNKDAQEQLVVLYGSSGDFENGPVHNLDEVMISWEKEEYYGPGFSLGDLNNDGRAELVLTAGYELAVLADLDSELTLVDTHSYDVYLGGQGPMLEDLNGDGLLDLIVLVTSSFSYIHGGTDSTFEPFGSSFSLGSLASIRSGDIDGDDRLDLIITDEYEITRLESEDVKLPHIGRLQTLPSIDGPALNRPESAHGDFNGDGQGDLAFAGLSFLITSWGDGGSFARASATALDGFKDQYTSLTATDINGDGRDELIVLDNEQDQTTVRVLSWHEGAWTPVGGFEVGDRAARTLRAADLDGDGIIDIAVAPWANGPDIGSVLPLYIYYGRPSAENMIDFDQAVQVELPILGEDLSGQSWLDLSLQSADLDGDSRPELLLDGPSINQTHLLWNNGERRWSTQTLPVHSARIVGVGELITLEEGALARLPVYGRRFGKPALISKEISAGIYTLIDGFSDCNGDGKPDLLIEHSVGTDLWIAVDDSFVRVWRTLGDNVRCADLNDDGSLDMVASTDLGVLVTLNGASE
ncbi:MAG TPA: VCBS repeat-containing protein, partial [Nannocystis exedens]|nr:VCBS repeat-containing protein [Nannocystis exedens]